MKFYQPWLCVEISSIMVPWHTLVTHLLKYYPQNFCGMCSFNGSNASMFLSRTWLLPAGYYDFITQTFSTTSNIYTGKALVGTSLIEMGLMFSKIQPESISDFNSTKKNLMWLADFRKENIKALSSKIFLVSKIFFKKAHVRKIIQFSDAEVAANLILFQ